MINLDEIPENKELSPGKLLLQGRLQVGLTQEQVAKELYLTVSKVSALEVDDFDRVGPDTFVRGYIRAYSNILKLEAAKILAAYEKCLKEKSQSSSSVTAPINVVSNKRAWKFGAFIVITFIGLWLISIWFFNSPTEKNYVLPAVDTSLAISVDNFAAASTEQQSSVSESLVSNVESSSVASVETQLSSVAAASVSAAIMAAPIAVNNSSKSSANISAAAKSSASIAIVKVNTPSNKIGLDEISFIFRGECWLEVSDSRGDVLATELQAAGSKLNLVGKAPFDVKLGNANAVSIQLNGKKIAVTPIPGSKVLSLKVNDN